MKKVIVHGSYHLGNFGDQLMLDLIAMEVKRRLRADPVCPWLALQSSKGCEAEAGHGLWSALHGAAAVLGGGGYFHNDSPQAERRLLRYLVPSWSWRLLQVPYVIIGVGAGPILTGRGASWVRAVANGARAVCVRDEESRDLLLDAGVNSNVLKVTADLVLSLKRETIPLPARELARQRLPRCSGQTRRLGIHFPFDPGTNPSTRAAFVEVMKATRGRDVQLVVLFDRGFDLQRRFEALASEYSVPIECVAVKNHWVEAALIGEMDAVITCGLHVGITAWALGIPACSYSMHGKTKRFYRQVGRQRFQADVATAQSTVVRDWIEMFFDDPVAFAREDTCARHELPLRAAENYDVMQVSLR